MRKLAIIIPAVIAAGLAWSAVASVVSSSWVGMGAADRWQLVMLYKGDAYVIDHGLTVSDCFGAMPLSDAAKGLSFQCEREA
ncbi:hypothetical protein [Novosphingobium sp. KN65.2]|uniref:hypothetical protein n=1 Tax=Novosphingobium sp. KN65.2 TaxID=1478134 RepID=UPI0005DE3B2A|nr:hypothetical protein [Novosphingobium sp. KN65.2]CDO34015.1 exported hypothetical protein [Novosphingobium sp. KN65.2]